MSKIVTKLGMVAAASAIGLAAFTTGAVSKELKLAHFVPARHHVDAKVFSPMAKELAKISGGKLTIKIFPGGALGRGPREQFKRAINRVADITFGLQGYTSKQFPRTLLAACHELRMPTPTRPTAIMAMATGVRIISRKNKTPMPIRPIAISGICAPLFFCLYPLGLMVCFVRRFTHNGSIGVVEKHQCKQA